VKCSDKPDCGCDGCHRRRMIVTLLRTLRDAGETLQRGDEGGKMQVGSRILLMPAAYHHGSYAELVIALARLRRMGPRHYWHVNERYVKSERLMRQLINRGGSYFETEEHVSYPGGERHVRYGTLAPLRRNAEVLQAVAQPKATVVRKPGDPRMVLVRAVVEIWDASVERRPLETGLDFLSAYLPASLVLPREIPVAA
jgi:hypothetical protein